MNLYARVQRGDVDQCSFGFEIKRETFVDLGGGACRWEIEEVDPLYEVTVCTFPAYEATGVSARKQQLEEIQHRAGPGLAGNHETEIRRNMIWH